MPFHTTRTIPFIALLVAGGEAGAHQLQLDLGLAGAVVEVRALASVDGAPLLTTQSSTGALGSAGRFDIPEELVGPDGVFLLTARGGQALDADGDGLADATATPNLGRLHAILTSAQIERGTARVSIASEVLFQRVRHHVAAELPAPAVVESLHARAAAMLAQDLDGDGDQDADDVAVLEVATDLGALHAGADYMAFTADLLAGLSPDRTAVLAKTEPRPPASRDALAGPAAADAAASTVAGDLVLTASGNAAEVFRFDPIGTPVLTHEATLPVTGTALDVAVRDATALVLSTGGLASFDITTPSAPQPIATLALPVSVLGQLVLVADHAYVGTGSGLRVVAVSPTGVLAEATGGAFEAAGLGALAAADGTLYAGAGLALHAFDIATDPAAPDLERTVTTTVFARHVAAASATRAIVGEFATLELVDFADPNPLRADWNRVLMAIGAVRDLQLRGHLLFVAGLAGGVVGGSDGVTILDVTDPRRMQELFHVPAEGSSPETATARDGSLFVYGDAGLRVYDADPLDRPDVFLGTSGRIEQQARRLALSGDLAYVGTCAGLEVYDVADPSAPVLRGAAGTSSADCATALAADGATVYVGASVLYVLDVADPDEPALLDSFDAGGFWEGITLDGDVLYGSVFGQLRSFDVASPTDPVELDAIAAGNAGDTARARDFLFVTDQTANASTRVIAIGDPGDLTEVAAIPIEGPVPPCDGRGDRPYAVAVDGSTAYVTSLNTNDRLGTCFQTVDVRNPAQPVVRGAIRIRGFDIEFVNAGLSGIEIEVANGYAYVATYALDGAGGNLLVIDVHDVDQPVVWGTIATPGEAQQIEIRDGRGYVADWDGGLHVIRVARRAVPEPGGAHAGLASLLVLGGLARACRSKGCASRTRRWRSRRRRRRARPRIGRHAGPPGAGRPGRAPRSGGRPTRGSGPARRGAPRARLSGLPGRAAAPGARWRGARRAQGPGDPRVSQLPALRGDLRPRRPGGGGPWSIGPSSPRRSRPCTTPSHASARCCPPPPRTGPATGPGARS